MGGRRDAAHPETGGGVRPRRACAGRLRPPQSTIQSTSSVSQPRTPLGHPPTYSVNENCRSPSRSGPTGTDNVSQIPTHSPNLRLARKILHTPPPEIRSVLDHTLSISFAALDNISCTSSRYHMDTAHFFLSSFPT